MFRIIIILNGLDTKRTRLRLEFPSSDDLSRLRKQCIELLNQFRGRVHNNIS